MPVQSQLINEFIAVLPPHASLLGVPLFPEALQDVALIKEFKRYQINKYMLLAANFESLL